MTEHANVRTVSRMTDAIFGQDRETLATLFTDDFVFHMRSPFPEPGDHRGVDGLLGVLGTIFELTGGDIKLDQRFCLAGDGWAAEFEHAVLGRRGATLESDNAFVYRFSGDRIAEMWMYVGALPDQAAPFFA